MMLFKHRKQQRYRGIGFYWILAAFFVVIFFSVLLNMSLYRNLIRNKNNEIESNFKVVYKNCLEQAALFIEEFYTISNEFIESPNFNKLANRDEMDNPEALLDFQNYIVRRYSLYTSSMRHLPYLYFKKSGFTLGQKGLNDAYKSGIITGFWGFTPEVWEEVSNPGDGLLCQIVKTEKMTSARLILSKEIYKDVIFVYCMSAPMVQESLNQFYLPEGTQSFLMDSYDHTINMIDAPDFPDAYAFSDITDISNGASVEYNFEEYFIFNDRIAGKPGKELLYIVLFPETLKEKQILLIRNALLFSTLIVICTGGIAAYFLSKRLYHPVSKMIETTVLSTGCDNDTYKRGEFRFISNKMNTLLKKIDAHEKKLDMHKQLFSENILASVMKNRTLGLEIIMENLDRLDNSIRNKRYAVFAIKVNDYSGWKVMAQEESKDESQAKCQDESQVKSSDESLFKNLYKDLKQRCIIFMRDKGFSLKFAEEDEYIFGIALFGKNDSNQLETAANELIIFIMNEMNIAISVFISDKMHALKDMNSGYQQVMELIYYNVLNPETCVTEIYRNEKEFNKKYLYEARFVENLKIMLNYIGSKDFIDAKRTVEKLYKEAFSKQEIPADTIKLQITIITDVFVMAIDCITDVAQTFIDTLNCEKRMSMAKCLPEFLEQSAFILDSVNEAYREEKNKTRDTEQIVSFIHENYCMNDFSEGKVAERFLLNTSTLSRIIKNEANMGFLDYVNMLRINKAKTLIAHTDLSLNDISEIVGYTNSLTMTRAFKKLEGITPGSLRKI